MYNWYQNIFHAIAVLIVFHAANEKPEENKIETRQQIKKGRSKHCCCRQSTWIIIAPLSHRYCSAVAPLSLRCCSVVAPLSHRYRTTIVPLSLRRSRYVVALLSHLCRTAIAPLSLRFCCSCCCYVVAPAIASAVAPFSRRCRTAVALLSLLSLRCRCCCSCCCSCCRNSITAAIAPDVTHDRCLKRQNKGNGFHR